MSLFVSFIIASAIIATPNVHADPDTVLIYNIISVIDLGPPAHDIEVQVEVLFCSACHPNPLNKPGCAPFTHGYPGPPPYPATTYWCGGSEEGRYVAVQLRDGAGVLVGLPIKTICNPTNCPLEPAPPTVLTFTFTGTGLEVCNDVTAEADCYCSLCGHWYPAPQTIHIEAPPPPPVGGVWIPASKTELLAPWIGLASLMIVSAASIVYVRHRKKQQN